MEINPTTLAQLQQIAITSGKIRVNTFQTGQTLTATVIAVQPNQSISLHVGNTILNASTPLPLSEGQQISLLVQKGGHQPIIKIDDNTVRSILIQFLQRQHVANQQPLPLTLASIEWLQKNTSNIERQKLIPVQLQEAIKRIHESMPRFQELTRPLELKQAIQNSGQFLENRLMKAFQLHSKTPVTSQQLTQVVSQDIKAQLLRLIALAQSLSPKLTNDPAESSRQALIQNLTRHFQQSSPEITDPETKREHVSFIDKVLRATTRTNISNPQLNPLTMSNTDKSEAEIPFFIVRLFSGLSQLGTGRLAPPPAKERAYQLLAQLVAQLKPATMGQPASVATPSHPAMKQIPLPMPGHAVKPQPRIDPKEIKFANEQNLIKRLNTEFRAALSRVQLQQATNLAEKDQGQQITTMEIPFRDNEEHRVLNLRIMEESHREPGKEEQEKSWAVMLALEVEPLGPVTIKVTWFKEKVSVFIWAEKPVTHQHIQQEIHDLQLRLEEQGLKTQTLACTQGTAPAEHRHQPVTGMIDFKA